MVLVAVALPEVAYSHKPITTNILFKNEIAQIFQRKCFQCHTENNLGVSLTTYTEARPWARAIREEVLERKMPPWSAVQGYGHFSNDLSLTQRETEIIISWADGGAPSGVPRAEESIPPVYVAPQPAWDHGEPDKVISIGDGQAIAAGAPFEVRRFVVSTGFTTPAIVHAIALKQGDRRVVRHAAFYEESTGRWLGAWTPWHTSSHVSASAAHRLPVNAKLVVEIGYSGTDQDVVDRSEIGLYVATAPSVPTDAMAIAAPDVVVSPGSTGQRVRTTVTLKTALDAIALWPAPSRDARSIEVTATTPDGVIEPILWIKDYRAEWQSPYVLSSPERWPAGTKLALTTYFDNPRATAEAARAKVWILTTAPTSRPAARTSAAARSTASRPAAAPRK
jgi:hypothetical protein